MTRCELATGLLTGYAAGELETLEAAIVAEHLAECAACRAELEREQRLRDLMTDLPDQRCPDHLTAAITAAVDADPLPRRRTPSRIHTWTGTVAAASLVAAAVLLALVLPRSTPLLDTAALDDPEPISWTQDELNRARDEAQWALAFTAQVIDRAEKQTIVDVMRRLQKEAYAGFRERTPSTSPGGRG